MSVRLSLPTIARGNFPGRRGAREIALIAGLYIFYTVTRTFAANDLAAAQDRAGDLLHLERVLHLDWEHSINNFFAQHAAIGIPACYWYASAHYVVTLGVLVWLWRKGPEYYTPARWVLVISCLVALACYLLLPTSPPRLTGGYVDILDLHAHAGWWGSDASAPKGLGGLTNELAAFPSLHAGWALWVALVVRRTTRNPWAQGLGWTHAFITAAVVIGTGNHWVLDVGAGWAIVIVAMWLVDPWFSDRRQQVHARRIEFHRRLSTRPITKKPAAPEPAWSRQAATERVIAEQPDPCPER